VGDLGKGVVEPEAKGVWCGESWRGRPALLRREEESSDTSLYASS